MWKAKSAASSRSATNAGLVATSADALNSFARCSTAGGSRSSGVANNLPDAGLAVGAPMGTANSSPAMTGDIQSRRGNETAYALAAITTPLAVGMPYFR